MNIERLGEMVDDGQSNGPGPAPRLGPWLTGAVALTAVAFAIGWVIQGQDSGATADDVPTSEGTATPGGAASTQAGPDTIADIFPDENLAACVAEHIGIATHQPVTDVDLATADSGPEYLSEARREQLSDANEGEEVGPVLACDAGIVEDLTGLERLDHIEVLSLDHLQDVDLDPIADLSELRHLILPSCQVSDLAPVGEVEGLRSFIVPDASLDDLGDLAGLTELRHVEAENTSITSFEGLEDATQLVHLHARGTQVEDLSSLDGHDQLDTVALPDTDIESIAPLADATG
ncbi:MAG TPA: hypothetical protein VK053_00990, partial [Jiangellaceae bacterium]|nr:hypothetical protein [Jiangellaceae bacterium]